MSNFTELYRQLLEMEERREKKGMWVMNNPSESGDMEIKLNVDSDLPIEIWFSFPSGVKTNLNMSIAHATIFAQKIHNLIAAFNTIKQKDI
jgi:hypothetical protein